MELLSDDVKPAPGVEEPEAEKQIPHTGLEIIRATRTWIQYGTVGFAVTCIVIGAVEALFSR